MKLSRLYSNKSDIFLPIDFLPGINVVLAEIRLPQNKNKDTHNLGKTTLGRLLDFCFLSKRDGNQFLFKHYNSFKGFIFFLEIELTEGSYLTIRRSVEDPSRIGYKKHVASHQDFSELPNSQWDHFGIPFDRAIDLLDSLLDWRGLHPWTYRKGLGYQLRTQDDYRDVFQLGKFANKHSEWKPYLAHILGFNSNLISSLYEKEDELQKNKEAEKTINAELGGSIEDISKIEGLLLLKQQESNKQRIFLDNFDFRIKDKDVTKELINEIDDNIANLNAKRYSLTQNKKKILHAMEEGQILFDPDEAETIFKQAGILFQGQIKRDFQQLIEFNKAITEERKGYLQDELSEIESEISNSNSLLNNYGKKRSEMLAFLSITDSFSKYKQVSDDLVSLRSDISSLERQRDYLASLKDLRSKIRILNEELIHLQSLIEHDVELQNTDKSSLFTSIRVYFNEIIETVISRKALLVVNTNKDGHLEFKAEILDEYGNETSAGLGHTYRKLLCIAFDLAILRAHLKERFPRFVFHDGIFESLDDRKKENLIAIIREYSSLGIQSLITLIDSELPAHNLNNEPLFTAEEIILTLHDENEQGRLFRMDAW